MHRITQYFLMKVNCYGAVIIALSLVTFATGCSTLDTGPKSESIAAYDDGQRAYVKNDFESAITHFENVTRNYPDSPITEVANYYLAKSFQAKGNNTKAISAYQSLISKYLSGYWVDLARKELKALK